MGCGGVKDANPAASPKLQPQLGRVCVQPGPMPFRPASTAAAAGSAYVEPGSLLTSPHRDTRKRRRTMSDEVTGVNAHATRGAFLKRAMMSMFVAIPAVKALASPQAAFAGGHASNHGGHSPSSAGRLANPGESSNLYVPCVDQPCQWTRSGGPCCTCCPFFCGQQWACLDPVTGEVCSCACGSPDHPSHAVQC